MPWRLLSEAGRKELGKKKGEMADIVTVIGNYVSLKQCGKEYQGVCPFCWLGDNTSFLLVNPTHQFYLCGICAEGGDAFHFLQKMCRKIRKDLKIIHRASGSDSLTATLKLLLLQQKRMLEDGYRPR